MVYSLRQERFRELCRRMSVNEQLLRMEVEREPEAQGAGGGPVMAAEDEGEGTDEEGDDIDSEIRYSSRPTNTV